nr:uncharacterized protein NKAPD1-like [Nerophis lumbriciformis]
MSKQTVGKTLLRNVIRHTDAHNKIQEESEMWKLRGWEVQMSNHSHVSATRTIRGQMHCDRLPYESRVSSEHDDREARYWTKKLYEFEDNDPDRWGHSGFKELYPEEFESESSTGKKEGHRRKVSKSKHSKKKKKKKKKKEEEAKRKKVHSSHEGNRTKSHHKGKKKDRKNEDRRGRKRKNDDSHKHSDSSKKSRRDWRAADEESTDESSEE